MVWIQILILGVVNEAEAAQDVAADYYDQDSDDDDGAGVSYGLSHLASTLGGFSLDYGNDLVAAPKKTDAQKLNYSKVAKRVDVKRLKNNMWESLKGETVIPRRILKR
jgi:condensin complex subunit 2